MKDAHDLGYDAVGTGGRRWARIYILQYLGCCVQVCPCLREMSCSLVRVSGFLTDGLEGTMLSVVTTTELATNFALRTRLCCLMQVTMHPRAGSV